MYTYLAKSLAKRCLTAAFIGKPFFPKASTKPKVSKESNRRFQQIPATCHSGKSNVSRLLIRKSFLTALCIALYLLTESDATVQNQKVPKAQMALGIAAS